MSDQANKPLLTFALIGYNQERFIREALCGAFSQTYSPLEIILSDDCSSDRTFEIMSEAAAAYRGPHRVVLNRNASRAGLGGHINRVMELVHGELVVVAAGDDVSLPERVEVICQAWQSDGKQATTIHSGFITIDEAGAPLRAPPTPLSPGLPLPLVEQTTATDKFLKTLEPSVTGCANAWSPRLFSIFGPLLPKIVYEDKAITFRSVLAGRILLVDVPLVKYRKHEGNLYHRSRGLNTSISSIRDEEKRLQNSLECRAVMYSGFEADLETARLKGILSEDEHGRCSSEAQRIQEEFELQARYLKSGFWLKTLILCRLSMMKLNWIAWRVLLRRWMPESVVLITKLGLGLLRARAQSLRASRPVAKTGIS
jgi:glycosyltransferase involved in cell wall biosynthesis